MSEWALVIVFFWQMQGTGYPVMATTTVQGFASIHTCHVAAVTALSKLQDVRSAECVKVKP